MSTAFEDLVNLMSRLRSPDGCPWDREQTYATLAPMLLEEAYEAFDAVEEAREGNHAELRDELGDLLFQIVFYAQVASERGEFSIEDVIERIHAKMVRRHPHVFSDAKVSDNEELLRNWEAMKAEEKRAAGKASEADADASLLDGVSSRLPALMEAHQLSTKAARIGFDWRNVEEIFDKLHEEIEELREAIKERREADDARAETEDARGGDTNDSQREEDDVRLRAEVGDVLFAVCNIARHLQAEPEAALKLTNRKFRKRFRYVERGLKERGRAHGSATLEEMEELWQEAKKDER